MQTDYSEQIGLQILNAIYARQPAPIEPLTKELETMLKDSFNSKKYRWKTSDAREALELLSVQGYVTIGDDYKRTVRVSSTGEQAINNKAHVIISPGHIRDIVDPTFTPDFVKTVIRFHRVKRVFDRVQAEYDDLRKSVLKELKNTNTSRLTVGDHFHIDYLVSERISYPKHEVERRVSPDLLNKLQRRIWIQTLLLSKKNVPNEDTIVEYASSAIFDRPEQELDEQSELDDDYEEIYEEELDEEIGRSEYEAMLDVFNKELDDEESQDDELRDVLP